MKKMIKKNKMFYALMSLFLIGPLAKACPQEKKGMCKDSLQEMPTTQVNGD